MPTASSAGSSSVPTRARRFLPAFRSRVNRCLNLDGNRNPGWNSGPNSRHRRSYPQPRSRKPLSVRQDDARLGGRGKARAARVTQIRRPPTTGALAARALPRPHPAGSASAAFTGGAPSGSRLAAVGGDPAVLNQATQRLSGKGHVFRPKSLLGSRLRLAGPQSSQPLFLQRLPAICLGFPESLSDRLGQVIEASPTRPALVLLPRRLGLVPPLSSDTG